MAKSKKKETKKASKAAAKPAQRSEGKATPVAEEKPKGVFEEALAAANAKAEAATATPGKRARDPRLPPPGTVLQKKDRHGNLRCEATVEDGGIRYNGNLHRSLSAAAMAAAKDIGLGGSQNGFLFWGVVKQERRAADPVAALERAWERYHARATGAVASTKSDDGARARVKDVFARQAGALAEIRQAL